MHRLKVSSTSFQRVSGETWWVDRYGNVETNISPEDLAELGLAAGDFVTLRIGAGVHNLKWVEAFGDVEEGEPLLHVDSAGLIAIAVRDGRADEHFDLVSGVSITLLGRR